MEKETPTNDSVDEITQPQGEGAVEGKEVTEPVMVPGDFVRITDRGFQQVKKLRDRGDALGRITKVHEADQDGVVSYDVEWVVIGGTSVKVAEYYLYGTTAAAEGLTTTRRREKRRPSTFAEDVIRMDEEKAERKAHLKAQKSTKKTAAKKSPPKEAKKAQHVKVTEMLATIQIKKPKEQKKTAAAKKQPSKRPAPASSKRKTTDTVSVVSKKRKTSSTPDSESEPPGPNVAPKGMDLYEKQRREFDRIMARLEKIDPFGWFWDPAPPEFDEKYNEPTDESKSVDAEEPKKFPYPDHAPYNWEMIRRRKSNGRYELDRAAREEKEYLAHMKPFYKFVGRRYKKQKQNPRVLYPIGVHWELFHADVTAMMNAVYERAEDPTTGGRTSVEKVVKKLREELDKAVERTGRRQERELRYYDDRHRFDSVLKQQTNTEAAMQSWRKTPFPERRYERLRKDVVSAGLSELDERTASYELRTSLPDSFVGLSYRYDDTGQSEAWMQSVVDEAGATANKGASQAKQAAMALAADEGVVRAQVVATMQSLLIGVQDRVMTDMSVLHQRELVSANWVDSEELMQEDPMNQPEIGENQRLIPEIVEQPVWGIDCYTRRNILICLDAVFDPKTSLTFVEKWLLPAINACPPDIAHDISNGARILEGLPFQMPSEEDRVEKLIEDENDSKSVQQWSHTVLGNALVEKIKAQAPPWLKAAANFIRRARESLGPNFFRVHPKGHGSVLLSQRVEANRLVTFYRGEIYPAWRWGEKMDAIEITQQRKGLRPTLPDFYNMALERPQTDPRGYGLLFVDASRKGGHGSSLSHSCQPTCEVRVAAMNGELCLAMTTLRELETGEELTFDYNAATDSLNEYQSALCLCGYGKCRGSFLHFATADCYQKVMNRNCPIASRFSNLIKGCMKQVMSEDDEKVLANHGFRTASFGAISVNRRDAESVNKNLSDTLDIVPVWLKTYAADTLRYIEYERRALPITLICDQMPLETEGDDYETTTSKKSAKEPTKPESSFFYFSRRQAKRIGDLLKKRGFDKIGIELQNAKQKVAAAYWNNLTEEKKEYWKQESLKDFERRKKEWKAEQALARKKAAKNSQDSKNTEAKVGMSFQDADAEGVSAMEHRIQHLTQALSRVGRVLDRHREGKLEQQTTADIEDSSLRNVVHSPLKVLSDAEVVKRLWIDRDGVVMSLSNYIATGECVSQDLRDEFSEVLQRYEASLHDMSDRDSTESREILKKALLELRTVILKNLQKMLKLFRKYKTQLSSEKDSRSVSPNPSLNRDIEEQSNPKEEVVSCSPSFETSRHHNDTIAIKIRADQEKRAANPGQHSSKIKCGDKASANSEMVGQESIDKVNGRADAKDEANIENVPSRNPILDESNSLLSNTTKNTSESLPSDRLDKNASETGRGTEKIDMAGGTNVFFSSAQSEPLQGTSVGLSHAAQPATTEFEVSKESQVSGELEVSKERVVKPCFGKAIESVSASDILVSNPWIDHYGERLALEAAADVLLLYANTSNFFVTNPYSTLKSTPVEVYARELGNAVPKTAIDPELLSPLDAAMLESTNAPAKAKSIDNDATMLCSPDDVVAKVTVQYGGEYVLSQLLQWYNGGIGQKQGLPDLSGCVTLPHISGCWSSPAIPKKKIRSDRKTVYDSKVRQQLVEWLRDPYKRGDPLPDEVKQTFYGTTSEKLPVNRVLFGSPILDFLVMGDESNIFEVLEELDTENKIGSRKALNDALSTVDRGRPAQAVCRWVQCENPDCLKWRKIPWHVDIDLLPETFFCKDNKWDPARTSCDVPEDDWDGDDKLVGADGKVEGSPIRKKGLASPSRETDFRVGAKFDVRRSFKGKDKFTVGTVTHVDFSGLVKRVKFHFLKTSADADEWVEFGSDRIATLHSKTGEPTRKKEKGEASGESAIKNDQPAAADEQSTKKGKRKDYSVVPNGNKAKKTLKKPKELKSQGGSTNALPACEGSTTMKVEPGMSCVEDPGSQVAKKLKNLNGKLAVENQHRKKKKKKDNEVGPEKKSGTNAVSKKDPKTGKYAAIDGVLQAKIPKKRKKKEHDAFNQSDLISVDEEKGENFPKKIKSGGALGSQSESAKPEPFRKFDSTENDVKGLEKGSNAELNIEPRPIHESQSLISSEKYTPDSQISVSGPRQVTVERSSQVQANAPVQSSTESKQNSDSTPAQSFQCASSITTGFSNHIQDSQSEQTNFSMHQPIQTSIVGGHGAATPHHGSRSDMFPRSQHPEDHGNPQQPFIPHFLQDRSVGEQGQQFSPYIAQPAPLAAPTANDANLLAALALRAMSNTHGQPPPDIQSLIRNAGSNPALLLQLQQFLQNQQCHPSEN